MNKADLIADLACGFTVAMTSLPQYVAYAELAYLPGAKGIMIAGFPLLAYSFGSNHKYLAVGFTSLTAMMAATDLDAETVVREKGQVEYELLLALYSGLVGVASLVLAAAGVGQLATKIPAPVLDGFKWAFSLNLLAAQSPSVFFAQGKKFYSAARAAAAAGPEVCGFSPNPLELFRHCEAADAPPPPPGSSDLLASSALLRGMWPWVNPLSWSLPTVCFALVATAAVKRGKKLMPSVAPDGLEVLIAVLICTFVSAQLDYSGSVVGLLPTGDGEEGSGVLTTLLGTPPVDLSALPWDLVPSLLPKAFLYAIISFASCSAICAGFEKPTDGTAPVGWSANRELGAHGVSNLAAMVVGSPPIGASLSRALVQKLAGARTAMSGAFAGLTAIALLPSAAPYLRAAPKATLAGIVVTAVIESVVWPKNFVKAVKAKDMATAAVIATTAFVFLSSGPTSSLIVGSSLHFGVAALKPKKA